MQMGMKRLVRMLGPALMLGSWLLASALAHADSGGLLTLALDTHRLAAAQIDTPDAATPSTDGGDTPNLTCPDHKYCARMQFAWGGPGVEETTAVVDLVDGGYLLAGVSRSWDPVGDALLVRINRCGEVLWAKSYGGPSADQFSSIAVAPEGGFVAVGMTGNRDRDGDAWVVKIDDQGVVQWSKVLGGNQFDAARSISVTSDQGFIISAATHSFGPGGPALRKTLVFKLDAQGTVQWSRVYSSREGNMDATMIQEVKDDSGAWDGFLLLGKSEGEGPHARPTSGDAWLMRLGADGTQRWSIAYGSTRDEDVSGFVQLPNRHFLVTGGTRGLGNTGEGNDIFVLDVAPDGTVAWFKRVDAVMKDESTAIALNHNRVVITAMTESFGAGGGDALVIEMDLTGQPQSAWTLGGDRADRTAAVAITWEGGMALGGRMASNVDNAGDVWFIRSASDGRCNCGEQSMTPSLISAEPAVLSFTPQMVDAGTLTDVAITETDVTSQGTSTMLTPCQEWKNMPGTCDVPADCEGRRSMPCVLGNTGTWSCEQSQCVFRCSSHDADGGSQPDGAEVNGDAGTEEGDGDSGMNPGPVRTDDGVPGEPFPPGERAHLDIHDAGSADGYVPQQGWENPQLVDEPGSDEGCTCQAATSPWSPLVALLGLLLWGVRQRSRR